MLGLLVAAPAHAEDEVPGPVTVVVVTAGLTWEDVSASGTPALSCLAGRSGAAAMNTTSTTPVSTRAQGLETVHTGYRGLAAQAPRSAGIPTPAVDRLAEIPGGVTEVPLDAPVDPAAIREAQARDGLVVVQAPSADAGPAAVDARVDEVLRAVGGCDAEDLPRAIVASVGSTDTGRAGARQQLQLLLDSGLPHQALTSGATHQSGIVALTDIAPTILASHDRAVPSVLPGQPVQGVDASDPERLALDRTEAARVVDAATLPALGSWMVPGVLGLIVLLTPLARRPRLAAVARTVLALAPLGAAVGLCAGLVPWWRADSPALALTGVVWAGSLLLSAFALAGPWRRRRYGVPGVVGALVVGIILLESATGSRLQLGSPLGAQAQSGGRYYGLSNHLAGVVFAGALMALLALFSRVTRPRTRVLTTVAVGAVVAGVCVAPSMGADFGSMLVAVPTFGILALLVSGIRPKVWHVLALGAGSVVAVLAVSVADWLRPPEQRSHLGRFIDDVLSGELVTVIVRKLAQNIGMVTGIWPLGLLVLVALALTVAMLMPRRARLHRLVALDAALPAARPVRIALAVGAWLGYAVNDTGPVLVAAMLGVVLALLVPMLPGPEVADAQGRVGADGGRPGSADVAGHGTADVERPGATDVARSGTADGARSDTADVERPDAPTGSSAV